ncbi:MAG TPA: serine/threonine-protein kinase [Kofleriaceae bacterium]|nr:serine/threonine-protein kinase [Kofleriaceae bacterium]
MDCLDANTVQDLMSGALDTAARGAVLGHLDTCDDCRELLGVTARHELTEHATTLNARAAIDNTVAAQHDALLATAHDTSNRIPIGQTPGATIGRYELDARIGAGAMGVVWRAHDPKLGRDVALKLLRRRDELLTERLVREAQAMAQISHPNVVAVYDVGSAGDATYIAMELVDGKSLRQWQLAERHTVPEIVGAYVAAGRGLAAAHGAGIVHRDFKADNVLVGSDGRVRVTDFGLAASEPAPTSAHEIADVELTTSGSVLGTPAYMAPEQFSGGNVDPRTDQFNFCASLYEALYGERPFPGAKFDELGANVIAGKLKPPPPGTQVSNGLRAIVVRGLSPKPSERFPSMDHLLAELGRDRARPWRRASIGAAALAAALVLGLVADCTVRDRVSAEIRTSFALTGKQLDRTTMRLRDFFRDSSGLALREPALRDLAGHRDQADFGLGTIAADDDELERLHGTFVSAELPRLSNAQLAIVDYKGRLIYTSYAPSVWNTDMRVLPPIRAALDAGTGRALRVMSYAELAPTKLTGATPHQPGLVLVFLQTLALGETPEARAIYLVLEDGKLVLDDLRLDDKTTLALVAPDGTAIGDEGITSAQIEAATTRKGVVELGSEELQARPLLGLDEKPIATVVMARHLDGVLTLFPHAQLVFALAALAAIAAAAATALRARDGVH